MSDENDSLPPRGTAREQRPPEQRPHPLTGSEPKADDLQEGHLGGPQTGSGPAQTRDDPPAGTRPPAGG